MEQYFKDLTTLVQNVYQQTNKKVVFVSHSLGSTITNLFLKSQTPKWRMKYIQGWYSINGLFGPNFVALAAISFGYNPGLPSFFDNIILKICREFPTFYSIIPNMYNSAPDKV